MSRDPIGDGSDPTDTRAAKTTRRSALAAVAAVSTGCLDVASLSARHPTPISVYNPASQPREASVVISDGDTTLVDTEITVPPRATVALAEIVLNQQTVAVAVTWDGKTTAYSWEVEESLEITLDTAIPIRTVAQTETSRGLRDDSRVDVRLDGDDGQTGTVRVTHDDQIEFETEWTFVNSRRVTYHDRLDGTGERVVTAQRGATEASRRVSLSEIVQVVADIKRTVQIGVYDVDRGTDSKR
jgi:hypothetical protein